MAAEKMKPVIEMYKAFNSSANPVQLLQTAAVNNEQFREIAQQVNNFNGDPHTAFLEEAKRRGLSDEEIQNGITQMENLLGIKRPY